MLVGYLGGRAAEELVFDTVTTGAANDIEQATKVARAMAVSYTHLDVYKRQVVEHVYSGKESMEKVLTAVSEEAAKQNVKEKLENQKKVG